MRIILELFSFVALVASVENNIGEQCIIHEKTIISCKCIGNEVGLAQRDARVLHNNRAINYF